MKFDVANMVQRGHIFAIVDEVDSILIDEARTPLIISGPSEVSVGLYYQVDHIIPKLESAARRSATSTATSRPPATTSSTRRRTPPRSPRRASPRPRSCSACRNLYDPTNIETLHAVQQALRAHTLYQLDRDYIVKDGQVIIVDEFTGRLMPGRRWSDGLHQAVEAKEGVKIEAENQTLATITLQNYFRMYEKLAGMTGTAETEADEFAHIYKLDVVVIPTNQPMVREDNADVIYRTEKEKCKAVVEEIVELHEAGQPVLVGTVSIEKSEKLAEHAQAARRAARRAQRQVPRARGRDRRPGRPPRRGHHRHQHGRPRHRHHPRRQPRGAGPGGGRPGARTPRRTRRRSRSTAASCAEERDKVLAAGGLHILGTERHEARRIDNQLRGRSGRQGDPGSSRFFLSLEDDLMRIFASDRLREVMERLGMEEDVPIESRMVTRSIERAQKQVEGRNFEIRKHLLEYDDVMNKQRESIYRLRRNILDGTEGREWVLRAAARDRRARRSTRTARRTSTPSEWDRDGARARAARRSFGLSLAAADVAWDQVNRAAARGGARSPPSRPATTSARRRSARRASRQLQRYILLSVLDAQWKDHLLVLDHLKEGIGMRAYGQRDPLVEYKRESFDLFQEMMERIEDQVVQYLYRVELSAAAPERRRPVQRATAVKAEALGLSAASAPRRSTPPPPARRPRCAARPPRSAATTPAPAAPARSTRSATARRSRPALRGRGLGLGVWGPEPPSLVDPRLGPRTPVGSPLARSARIGRTFAMLDHKITRHLARLAPRSSPPASARRAPSAGTPQGRITMPDHDIPLALTFDDVLLVPARSEVHPAQVDVSSRLVGGHPPQRAGRLGRHGHRDRGPHGDRHGAAGWHRRHPPQPADRRPGGGGRPGQALRVGDDRRPGDDPARPPRRRGARDDGPLPASRGCRWSTSTASSRASSPTATCASAPRRPRRSPTS